MACKSICSLCDKLIVSSAVTFAAGTLTINIPEGSYENGEKYCIVIAQTIPDTATINAPVVVTIGAGTTAFPLVNKCCKPVTASAVRTRTKYSTVVATTATGANFKLLGDLCCRPNNDLAAINGTTQVERRIAVEVRDYEQLKKKLCKELEETMQKSRMGMAEIEIIDKLTHSIKNINKIIEYEGKDYSNTGYNNYGMSQHGMSRADNSYDMGNSRGMSGMNYSYDSGNSEGRYSRGQHANVQSLQRLLNDNRLSQEEKMDLRGAIEEIKGEY